MQAAAIKETHIGRQREAASNLEQEIIRVLNGTYLGYCLFKFNRGLRFLDDYCHGDEVLYRALSRSATFWGWWKNQWTVRDRAYLVPEVYGLKEKTRWQIYGGTHDARSLSLELHVPEVIVESALRGAELSGKSVRRAAFGGYKMEV